MRTPRVRRVLVGLAALAALACSASAQTLRIYVIDVEQGASTLLVSPGGHTLLVDSGKNSHGVRISAVMLMAGVSRIDHLVLTHWDRRPDHQQPRHGGHLHDGGTISGEGNSVSVALSHEVIEAFVDPDLNLWAEDEEGTLWAYEACDPVEAGSYQIRIAGEPVYVSNFDLAPATLSTHTKA